MTVTPIPEAAIAAQQPTSRAVFRFVAKAVGATNREADTLRQDLLGRIGERKRGLDDLVAALREIDRADPTGDLGAESRLAVWFAYAGQATTEDDAPDAGARLVESWADGTDVAPSAVREVVRLLQA